MIVEHRRNDMDRGERKYPEKTCPRATLSITHLTLTELGSNLGLLGNGTAAAGAHCYLVHEEDQPVNVL
jgi:hypothetical protein